MLCTYGTKQGFFFLYSIFSSLFSRFLSIFQSIALCVDTFSKITFYSHTQLFFFSPLFHFFLFSQFSHNFFFASYFHSGVYEIFSHEFSGFNGINIFALARSKLIFNFFYGMPNLLSYSFRIFLPFHDTHIHTHTATQRKI
jgi:hypothetical protein